MAIVLLRTALVLGVAAEPTLPPAALQQRTRSTVRHPLDTLAPRHWLEVPDSHLMRVAFAWPKGGVFSLNSTGPKGVVSLWSKIGRAHV